MKQQTSQKSLGGFEIEVHLYDSSLTKFNRYLQPPPCCLIRSTPSVNFNIPSFEYQTIQLHQTIIHLSLGELARHMRTRTLYRKKTQQVSSYIQPELIRICQPIASLQIETYLLKHPARRISLNHKGKLAEIPIHHIKTTKSSEKSKSKRAKKSGEMKTTK